VWGEGYWGYWWSPAHRPQPHLGGEGVCECGGDPLVVVLSTGEIHLEGVLKMEVWEGVMAADPPPLRAAARPQQHSGGFRGVRRHRGAALPGPRGGPPDRGQAGRGIETIWGPMFRQGFQKCVSHCPSGVLTLPAYTDTPVASSFFFNSNDFTQSFSYIGIQFNRAVLFVCHCSLAGIDGFAVCPARHPPPPPPPPPPQVRSLKQERQRLQNELRISARTLLTDPPAVSIPETD